MVTGEERGVHLSGSGYSELHSLALHCSNPSSRTHSARDSLLKSFKLFPREALDIKYSPHHCVNQCFINIIRGIQKEPFHFYHFNPYTASFWRNDMVVAWSRRDRNSWRRLWIFLEATEWRTDFQRPSSWKAHDLGVTINFENFVQLPRTSRRSKSRKLARNRSWNKIYWKFDKKFTFSSLLLPSYFL